MIFDDETIDFKVELKKANNKLSDLRQKYQELEADRDYIKSLLNRSHEHNYKLKKENEQLKQLLDYADDIIKTHTNQDVVRQWENIKKNVKGDSE